MGRSVSHRNSFPCSFSFTFSQPKSTNVDRTKQKESSYTLNSGSKGAKIIQLRQQKPFQVRKVNKKNLQINVGTTCQRRSEIRILEDVLPPPNAVLVNTRSQRLFFVAGPLHLLVSHGEHNSFDTNNQTNLYQPIFYTYIYTSSFHGIIQFLCEVKFRKIKCKHRDSDSRMFFIR